MKNQLLYLSIGIVLLLILLVVALNVCTNALLNYVVYIIGGVAMFLIIPKTEKSVLVINGFKIVGGGAIAIYFIKTDPIAKYNNDRCTVTRTVTVIVHGKKGKSDLVLTNDGKVFMEILNKNRREAPINVNGEADFTEIDYRDRATLSVKASEPFEPTYPDSVYNMESTIYLEVQLRNIGLIKGRITYKDNPLPGVTIICDTLQPITSDSLGNFKIPIPENMQAKKYDLYVHKDGFGDQKVTSLPENGEVLPIFMKKVKTN